MTIAINICAMFAAIFLACGGLAAWGRDWPWAFGLGFIGVCFGAVGFGLGVPL